MLFNAVRPHRSTTNRTCIASCLALIMAILCLLFPGKALAHGKSTSLITNGVDFRVSARFDARYRDGNWVPVQVTLTNDGADFNGAISLTMPSPYAGNGGNTSASSIYEEPINLATGSHKQVTLYVPLYFGSQGTTQTLEVDLLDNNGNKVGSHNTILRTLGASDIFVGVLSDQTNGFGPLNAVLLPNQ